jgi:hypothetical protein
MSIITVILMVVWDQFNIAGIYTSGNYEQKWIAK